MRYRFQFLIFKKRKNEIFKKILKTKKNLKLEKILGIFKQKKFFYWEVIREYQELEVLEIEDESHLLDINDLMPMNSLVFDNQPKNLMKSSLQLQQRKEMMHLKLSQIKTIGDLTKSLQFQPNRTSLYHLIKNKENSPLRNLKFQKFFCDKNLKF